ncbi:MAG TPA: hypothetical protein VFT22_10850, partial [Kofleriaceae bacterium]|nr:hypothetical protein [Kofleriaceae bacterium]
MPVAKVQTPNVDQIIATGIDALLAQRPSAGPFVHSGHYGDIFAGWRAQLLLLNRRLVDECKAGRLPLAEGKALIELAASEFFAELPSDPQTAVGEISLIRPTATVGSGVIKQGTKFRLVPSTDPAVRSAFPVTSGIQYVTTEPVLVGPTDLSVNLIPIRATAPGAGANIPRILVGAALATMILDDTLFDQSFTVNVAYAAGGSSGISSTDIRNFARAMYTGQYAATDGALLAGALSDAGVKHVALANDTQLARTVLFVADESWAWSQNFLNQCMQVLKDTWVGFGARIAVMPIDNTLIGVNATVMLTDPKYANDTLDLRNIVRTAIRKYFDERADFYTFDMGVLAAVITASDPRILSCTSVTLLNPDGTTIPNPPA